MSGRVTTLKLTCHCFLGGSLCDESVYQGGNTNVLKSIFSRIVREERVETPREVLAGADTYFSNGA